MRWAKPTVPNILQLFDYVPRGLTPNLQIFFICVRVGLLPPYKSFLCVSTWAKAHPTNLFYVSLRGLTPTLQIFFMCIHVGLRPTYKSFFICIHVGLRPLYKSFLCVSTWGYAHPTNLFYMSPLIS